MPRDLARLLDDIGLAALLPRFEEAGVDLDVLGELTAEDFREIGISLGDRKRIQRALQDQSPDEGVVERRFLSLLFVDVVGSTEMSARMDPEDYRRLMTAYQSKCEAILKQKEGHLARKFGDGILAYFGFPRSYENDTLRAADAALQIVAAIPALTEPSGRPLQVRIGMATGLALVDEILSADGRERGQVFGETPNLAARLQGLAKPGGIVLCKASAKILERRFEMRSLGMHDLKGLPAPVESFELGGPRARGAGASPGPASSGFLNRTREIDAVQARWTRALEGDGQIVQLEGCAGIGKSALLEHLMEFFAADGAALIYWRCDIDQRGRPLHPVAGYFTQAISERALLGGDQNGDARAAFLAEQAPNGMTDALLDAIMGTAHSETATSGSPDVRAAIFDLLERHIVGLTASGPVVLVIDDMHWIDPTTLEFLGEISSRLSGRRLLILCAQRDTERQSIPKAQSVARIQLEPLGKEISGQIVARELAELDVSMGLQQQIIARCEGIPFYVEEVARAVRETGGGLTIPEQGRDVRHGDVPMALMGPLLSRLDRRPGTREVASFAAAIGRQFSLEMLRKIMPQDMADLEEIMTALVEGLIVRPVIRSGATEFEFSHAVMRDAAYQVLLKDRRIAAHAAIAQSLRDGDPGTSARPANIAYHFEAAEMWPQARSHWMEAVTEMQGLAAHREAISYCSSALAANARIGASDKERDTEIEIREMMFLSQEGSEWWSKDIVENLNRIRELRAARGDSSEILTVIHGLAGDHVLSGQFAQARGLAGEMLSNEGFQTDLAQILACRVLGICDFFTGQLEDAITNFEKTIELAPRVPETALKEYYFANTVIVSSAFIAWAKALLGRKEDAAAVLARVIEDTASEEDDLRKLYGSNMICCVFQALGQPGEVLSYAEPAKALAKEADQIYWYGWASIMHGWARGKIDPSTAAITEIEGGISDYESTGVTQILPYARSLLAEIHLDLGQKKEAARILSGLDQSPSEREMRLVDPMIEDLTRRL